MSSKRIHNIIEHMTYEIYLYIQRGLFERHKIIFALLLALSVLTSAGKVSQSALQQWDTCLVHPGFRVTTKGKNIK